MNHANVDLRNGTVFLWCHDTIGLTFETGIQRVVRRLGQGLIEVGFDVVPVGWNRQTRCVVAFGSHASAFADRSFGQGSIQNGEAPWLLIPEITLELSATNLDPVQLGQAYGLRTAALIHDLIPLKLSGDYNDSFLAQFRRYVTMFANADLVFSTTHYVAEDLRAYLGKMGLRIPKIVTIPLASQFADRLRCLQTKSPRTSGAPLRLLSVSTWEPRKNLPRLLRAICQAERRSGLAIELTVVGQQGHFKDYDAEVGRLISDMPKVTSTGSISDEDLADCYAGSHASIYPSIEEGFGLPIGESLWLATPCICHSGSSMAEIAPGGGTLIIDMTDESAISNMLLDVLSDPDVLARLSAETVMRPLSSWRDYACNIGCKLIPN